MKAEPYWLPLGAAVVEFFPQEPAAMPEEFQYDARVTVKVTLKRVAPEVLAILLGMPHYFRFRPPAIEAPRPRLALPWGDSAYTTLIAERWLIGHAEPEGPIWMCGPPDNGLTPSSEGPRRDPYRPIRTPTSAATLETIQRVHDLLRTLDL